MPFSWIAPCDDPFFNPLVRRYNAALGELPPDLSAAGQSLLERISTRNWLLEWNLPRWLGEAFDLPAAASDALTLGNIFGLATVRLQDDLFDGETRGEWEGSVRLVKALHQCWMEQYTPWFERSTSFWETLDRFTGQWLRASLEAGGPDGAALRSGQAGAMLRLAERGAPLKVCAVAAGLLAGRELQMPQLMEGIDHFLAGAVLVDHFDDWQTDVKFGRYNALVAYLAPGGRGEPGQDDTRRAVLEELYLGSTAGSYFELAKQQFRHAAVCARGMGVPKFAAYLDWAVAETAGYHARLVQRNSQRLHSAAGDLLGSMEQVGLSEI